MDIEFAVRYPQEFVEYSSTNYFYIPSWIVDRIFWRIYPDYQGIHIYNKRTTIIDKDEIIDLFTNFRHSNNPLFLFVRFVKENDKALIPRLIKAQYENFIQKNKNGIYYEPYVMNNYCAEHITMEQLCLIKERYFMGSLERNLPGHRGFLKNLDFCKFLYLSNFAIRMIKIRGFAANLETLSDNDFLWYIDFLRTLRFNVYFAPQSIIFLQQKHVDLYYEIIRKTVYFYRNSQIIISPEIHSRVTKIISEKIFIRGNPQDFIKYFNNKWQSMIWPRKEMLNLPPVICAAVVNKTGIKFDFVPSYRVSSKTTMADILENSDKNLVIDYKNWPEDEKASDHCINHPDVRISSIKRIVVNKLFDLFYSTGCDIRANIYNVNAVERYPRWVPNCEVYVPTKTPGVDCDFGLIENILFFPKSKLIKYLSVLEFDYVFY